MRRLMILILALTGTVGIFFVLGYVVGSHGELPSPDDWARLAFMLADITLFLIAAWLLLLLPRVALRLARRVGSLLLGRNEAGEA